MTASIESRFERIYPERRKIIFTQFLKGKKNARPKQEPRTEPEPEQKTAT